VIIKLTDHIYGNRLVWNWEFGINPLSLGFGVRRWVDPPPGGLGIWDLPAGFVVKTGAGPNPITPVIKSNVLYITQPIL